jgi:hypothetical protein
MELRGTRGYQKVLSLFGWKELDIIQVPVYLKYNGEFLTRDALS